MAKGPAYKVKFRRARSGLTNYRRRRRLISAKVPRLVVRKSNRYVYASLVTSEPQGDVTTCTTCSRELSAYGWKLGFSNSMASYLAGMICGVRAKARGVSEAILDMGLHQSTKGGNVYAACRGAMDAGLSVRLEKKMLASDDRIGGKIVSSYYEKLRASGPEARQFSSYARAGVDPSTIGKIVQEAKEGIQKTSMEGSKDAQ